LGERVPGAKDSRVRGWLRAISRQQISTFEHLCYPAYRKLRLQDPSVGFPMTCPSPCFQFQAESQTMWSNLHTSKYSSFDFYLNFIFLLPLNISLDPLNPRNLEPFIWINSFGDDPNFISPIAAGALFFSLSQGPCEAVLLRRIAVWGVCSEPGVHDSVDALLLYQT